MPDHLVIVASAGPRNSNGGIHSLFELTKHLADWDVTLVTQRDAPLLQKWRTTSISTKVIPYVGYTRYWTSQIQFAKLFRRLPAKAVVCNDIVSMLCVAPIARLHSIPVVFFVRDIFEPNRRYGCKWQLAAQLASTIVVLSEEMQMALNSRLRAFTRKIRIEPVYSNVDLQAMRPPTANDRRTTRRELGIEQDEFAIVYTAGFCDKKNQLELIKALPSLFNQMPSARVHFVGDFASDDPYCNKCASEAASLGILHRMVFHGYCSAVSRWYQAADCTLLASRREGLARAMIESLACGTPVVSFDVCSAEEILSKSGCGFVAAQGDYDELFGAVTRLNGNEHLRNNMGQSGRELSERLFDPIKNTARFSELIHELCRSTR